MEFQPIKLCLADAIPDFKWVEIIQILLIVDWCHILFLACSKTDR